MIMETSNGTVKQPVVSHKNGTINGAVNGNIKILETNSERRCRIISLVIIYFTLFLQSLGLAITMTGWYDIIGCFLNYNCDDSFVNIPGVWPFLDKVS